MLRARATSLRLFVVLALIAFLQAREVEPPYALEAGPTAFADGRLLAVCTAVLPIFAQIEAKPQYSLKPDASNKLLSADGRRAARAEALRLPGWSPAAGASLSNYQRPLWLLYRVLLI